MSQSTPANCNLQPQMTGPESSRFWANLEKMRVKERTTRENLSFQAVEGDAGQQHDNCTDDHEDAGTKSPGESHSCNRWFQPSVGADPGWYKSYKIGTHFVYSNWSNIYKCLFIDINLIKIYYITWILNLLIFRKSIHSFCRVEKQW